MEDTKDSAFLQRQRPLILLAEIIGFLHDIGKLDNKCWEEHNERIWNEFGIENPNTSHGDIPKAILDFFRNIELKNAFKDGINDKILDFLSQKVNKALRFRYEPPTICSPIFYHHFKDGPNKFEPRNIFEKIIGNADSQDSSEDKGAHEEDSLSEFYISSPFGLEEKLDEKTKKNLENLNVRDRTECRKSFYKELEKLVRDLFLEDEMKLRVESGAWKDFREKFYETTETYFSLSLAETRRPANDINLFDHCYMTGSMAKAIISNLILNDEFKNEIQKRKEYEFKLFVVGFDGYEFLTRVNRLPDFIGREVKLEKIRENVKNCVEFEIPLGNLIYEDLSIMCFLIIDTEPNSNRCEIKELKNRIEKEFLEETNGILFPFVGILGDKNSKQSKYIGPLIENAKKTVNEKMKIPYSDVGKLPWMDEWKNQWMCLSCNNVFEIANDNKCPLCDSRKIKKREKCDVCGYAPEYPISESVALTRKERLCQYCYSIRLGGIDARRYEDRQTLWLDELRDENNTIALIVGKITPIEGWLNGELIRKTMRNVFIRDPVDLRAQGKTITAGRVNGHIGVINSIRGVFRNNVRKKELLDKVRKDLKNPYAISSLDNKMNEFSTKNPSSNEINSLIEEIKHKECEKSPSPSRLRRVWKEILQFSLDSETLSKAFLEKKKLRKRLVIKVNEEPGKVPHLLGDAKLCNIDIGCIIYEGDKTILTANFLDSIFNKKSINDYEEKELKDSFSEALLDVEWYDGTSSKLRIQEIKKVEYYLPITSIYGKTGEFMFLFPASHGIALSRIIQKEFFRRYEKVLGKLNLNLGLIYFKYKQPLYLILDAGKRLLNEFENDELKKMKEYETKKLEGEILFKKLNCSIHMKFPDGDMDYYYPYFFLKDGNMKNICELQSNDIISIHPSFFDFEFLDTTTRRFDIILENGKRPHRIFDNGPRPYYLEEIKNFEELWDIFCGKNKKKKKITSSQLHNFHMLLITKIEEWNLRNLDDLKNDTFEKFVEDSIINILEIQKEIKKDEELTDFEIIKQSILSGLFFDVFELYMTIMKQKPEGDKNEQ